MDNTIEEIKSSGLKATVPRLKILEAFQNAEQRHLTAEDVYKLLLDSGSDIGLATVYRVLAQFEQAGILSRNHFDPNKAIYELHDEDHHDHMVCLSCGRVEEFLDEQIEQRQLKVASSRGWTLEDHSMALYGLCPDCVAKKGKKG